MSDIPSLGCRLHSTQADRLPCAFFFVFFYFFSGPLCVVLFFFFFVFLFFIRERVFNQCVFFFFFFFFFFFWIIEFSTLSLPYTASPSQPARSIRVKTPLMVSSSVNESFDFLVISILTKM
eukprot:TRINITY_DN21116_c0_g2_i1.p2 TRINITY_DN21116_c0_g2~~TRINITY_DN21116_c0_g2_i1.p2  ORF type:complete len:121 (-),score=24.02 TRINITY_DN21116_c0_g2_i1:635-997(-)